MMAKGNNFIYTINEDLVKTIWTIIWRLISNHTRQKKKKKTRKKLTFSKKKFNNELDRFEMVEKTDLKKLRSLQGNAHLIIPIYNLNDRNAMMKNPHISERALHRIRLVQDKTRWAPRPTVLLRTDAALTIPAFENT